MHEILTLQLGHRANHVGTHFWNAQESYFTYPGSSSGVSGHGSDDDGVSPVDHDVHWRAGIGPAGEDTYTPRVLIYDLKGGFGSMRVDGWEEGGDGGEGNGNGVWDGNVSIIKAPPVRPSDYQLGLDAGLAAPARLTVDTVRYWSDHSRVLYHPKTSIQINDYELNSALLPFERWESGEELFAGLDREVDVLDRDLRGWAEECDALQGIQFVAGGDDAWGGFAARYVERVRDEFGKLGIWVWALEEERGKGPKVCLVEVDVFHLPTGIYPTAFDLEDVSLIGVAGADGVGLRAGGCTAMTVMLTSRARANQATQMLRTTNAARSIYDISAHASMYMPLAIPSLRLPSYVQLARSSLWHTSALLSTALESMTLPSRLRPGGGTRGRLDDMAAALNVNGRQRIANVQMSITDPLVSNHSRPAGGKSQDSRMRGSHTDGPRNEDQSLAGEVRQDMDFYCGEAHATRTNAFRAPRPPRRHHVFGRVDSVRGNVGDTGDYTGDTRGTRGLDTGRDDEDEVGDTRKRRRLAALPRTERYHSRLRFPLLDSFPDIFADIVVARRERIPMIDVQTSLSTTSMVSQRVQSLRAVVGAMVGLDEREALSNGLGEIGEQYEEGWHSGSDDDSDD
ncbi:mtDNA inheritance, partitioning of the mitochondrial organelle [Pseudocyphellaria aurata]|nr:mtDNA inheritance, partitioning of the mitochondrial organelle [Pseudocyphellaria aurata]